VVERSAVNRLVVGSNPTSGASFQGTVYVVYVIRSASVGRLYIGHTSNLSKRLNEHNDPECFSSKFTKRIPGPLELIYQEKFSTRKEAFRRERWFKTGRGRRYLQERLDSGC
jgi:putative endonuclease